jgi:Tfp pilus assembly protein PilF
VHDDPQRAVALADAVIDASGEDDEVATALWARGSAWRELGDLEAAARDLRRATDVAADLPTLRSEILCTLAMVLLYRGETAGALDVLNSAAEHADAASMAKIEMQRALVLHRLGDLATAAATYETAIAGLERSDDGIPLARAHSNLGVLLSQTGEFERAAHHLTAALELAEAMGQTLLAAAATHNLGYLRGRQGRVIEALGLLDRAEVAYRSAGEVGHLIPLLADRAAVHADANLLDDALADALVAIRLGRARGNVTDLADVALLAARCALAAGDADEARLALDEAEAGFRAQGRLAWLPLVRLAALEVALATQRDDAAPIDDLASASTELDVHGWRAEARAARVLAGRVALDHGEPARAKELLAEVAQGALDAPIGERAAEALASALLARAVGDRVVAADAVSGGLRLIAEHVAAAGSFEVRARLCDHAATLRDLGVALAIEDADAETVIRRMEEARWALTGLSTNAGTVPDEVGNDLAALRALSSESAAGDQPERRRLERRIQRALRTRSRVSVEPPSLSELSDAAAGRSLVVYAEHGDRVHPVTVTPDGARRVQEPVPIDAVRAEVDAVWFALHRLQRRQSSEASRRAALGVVDEASRRLEVMLLPVDVRDATGLVIVPSGALHGVAWRVLPSLLTRPWVVAPSLTAWARALPRRRPLRAVAAIAGPGLGHAVQEVRAVATCHAGARVLAGADASATTAIEALTVADLAHIASHGRFRVDSAMFSSLRMDGGDLTIFDLEGAPQLPSVFVLSACDAAQSTVLRGGALLGLSSALVQFGVSSVIAPLTPVNDERSVDVMVRLHTHLAAGRSPAVALALASVVDGELDPTAASFVCMGS